MGQVVVAALSLILLINGIYAALSPRRWVCSRWTFRGITTAADMESPWLRSQVRGLGVILTSFGAALAAVALRISVANHLLLLTNILMFVAFLCGGILMFIWPEQNLMSALRSRLPERRWARWACLGLLRLLAVAFLVMVIAGAMRLIQTL